MFYSFNGKQYSCNPRRISDQLKKEGVAEIIWAFKDPDKFSYLKEDGIRTVRYRSLKYYYLAKTSSVVVFNVQGYGELARRKGQIFIQTWHASNGYKKVGNFTGIARKVNLLGHRDYSYVCSGAESMTERRVRGSMGFRGEIIPGTPRMDILIRQDDDRIPARVREGLGYEEGAKLLLYAPTWRSSRKSEEEYTLDYEKLHQKLTERFGGSWIIAVRLHPNVKDRIRTPLAYVRDATDYPDMQDLLYTADMLISDYSSCIWDYSFTYRPCFLYCYDLKEYYQEKSFDLPIEKWRFPIAETMDELLLKIDAYEPEAFRRQMELHQQDMGSLEDGHATERVLARICDSISSK
jgi:CDP-glycerol glycerophosphotransferase